MGMLWHQGEHDAFEGNPPENYYSQLTDIVTDFRGRYGNIPFMAADFVHDWKNKNMEQCAPIVDVIRRVVKESGNAYFVESEGLLSNDQKIGNGDDIHFCRESAYELGVRYFQGFEKLKKNYETSEVDLDK